MIETFTNNPTVTSNGIEKEHPDHIEAFGPDELSFYSSLANELQAIERTPKASTFQNILNYSENYNPAK